MIKTSPGILDRLNIGHVSHSASISGKRNPKGALPAEVRGFCQFQPPKSLILKKIDWVVLPVRIELTTSALPRMRSTTELRQHVRSNREAALWRLPTPFVKARSIPSAGPPCSAVFQSWGLSPRRRSCRGMTRNRPGLPKRCAPICAGERRRRAARQTLLTRTAGTIRTQRNRPRGIRLPNPRHTAQWSEHV